MPPPLPPPTPPPAHPPDASEDPLRHPLDALEPDARQLLEAVAILGPAVPGVVRVVARLPESSFPLVVAELVRAGLLRERGGRLEPAHALVRDAVRAGIDPERARTLHRRAADAQAAAGAPAAVLARHHERAGQAEQAAAGWLRAAAAVIDLGEPAEALNLVSRASRLLTGTGVRCDGCDAGPRPSVVEV